MKRIFQQFDLKDIRVTSKQEEHCMLIDLYQTALHKQFADKVRIVIKLRKIILRRLFCGG
jgi:hypothetical protein